MRPRSANLGWPANQTSDPTSYRGRLIMSPQVSRGTLGLPVTCPVHPPLSARRMRNMCARGVSQPRPLDSVILQLPCTLPALITTSNIDIMTMPRPSARCRCRCRYLPACLSACLPVCLSISSTPLKIRVSQIANCRLQNHEFALLYSSPLLVHGLSQLGHCLEIIWTDKCVLRAPDQSAHWASPKHHEVAA